MSCALPARWLLFGCKIGLRRTRHRASIEPDQSVVRETAESCGSLGDSSVDCGAYLPCLLFLLTLEARHLTSQLSN
ncbi:hypothetical protein KSP40_PGU014901 [Platanthera guangdongensis]|uniref:Uncharacterized protein n=1 Tax=Platanthera guangdongensis TaxID=2320717 RepID=A0ABR2MQN3_9ASPA